jgi:regulator of replication initiation timing
MRLNLGELQAVVKRTLDEERAVEALKQEIKRVLGPAVIIEGKLEEVTASANAWMDVLDRTGRSSNMDFTPLVTTGFLDHRHPAVREFAARVVPEKFLGKLTKDPESRVRHIVASRVPLPVVREMLKSFKNDDELRLIYKRRKKLHEAGIAQPKVEPMGHDPGIEGRLSEPMGKSAKQAPVPDLSENWYKHMAWRLMHEYGRNIEYAWEELAVRRLCSSIRATSLVEVDAAKLLKHVKDLIKEKEELAMERNALRETLAWLDKQAEQEKLDEALNENTLPELKEVDDPVRALVESRVTPEQFIEHAKVLFRIQEGQLPMAIRKYRLGEGNTKVTAMPVIGWLPHGGSFRAIDERALDMFCEHWNKRQAADGEPVRLKWSTHPTDISKVGFSAMLS